MPTRPVTPAPVESPLDAIFRHRYTEIDPVTSEPVESKFKETLDNLARLRPPKAMPGKPFKKGESAIGFKRNGRNLNITIACGRAIVRQIELLKYVTMIEKMHDERNATVVLENFSDADEYKASRGQTLGRFNPTYSCITVAQGLTGRVIHDASDVVRMDAYYFDKDVLTAFYITSKLQLGMENKLSELIGAYDGWKVFELPVDPCNPDGEVGDEVE